MARKKASARKKEETKKKQADQKRIFDSHADDPLNSFSREDYTWAERHHRPIRGIRL